MTSDSASRVTRSRRHVGLAAALFAAGLVVTALRAQETPAPASAPAVPPATQTPGATGGTGNPQQPAAAPAPTAGAAQPAPQAAPRPPADAKGAPPGATSRGPEAAGRTQEHFEPTEKVRADFDVSFPVDI